MFGIQIISGTSNTQLSEEISSLTKTPLTPVTIKNFVDGEKYVRVQSTVRGENIFIIQSVSPPVNDNLMELLILIDSVKRGGANQINVVAPYLGYSRQDRKSKSREPITAKLVANMITKAGADRLLTFDLHADQIQGFYDIPVDHFLGFSIFAQHLETLKLKDIVVVSPDIGGVKRANRLADYIGVPIAIIDKIRSGHNKSEVAHLVGEVKGKTAIIIDDMVDTGGSICNAAEEVKKQGAKKVIICASHGVLSNDAIKNLDKSVAEKVLLLNTIQLPAKLSKKFTILTVAPVIADAIIRIHENKSLEPLFVN